MNTIRTLVGLLATVAFVVVFPTRSSRSSVPKDPPNPPSVEEVAAWEELIAWVQGDEGGRFELDSEGGLASSVRERRRGFQLFRDLNSGPSRHRFLDGLPFGSSIAEAAERNRLDELLLAAVVRVESSFDPSVVSPQGASGLMQLMPATGRSYGAEDLLAPEDNLNAGAGYLRWLLDLYGGDLELALAAYNAGPGNVRRFGGVPPFRETTRYVERVLETYVGYHRAVWEETPLAQLLPDGVSRSPEGESDRSLRVASFP